MPSYGYSLMCELYDPNELLAQAAGAEAAGFDFLHLTPGCSRQTKLKEECPTRRTIRRLTALFAQSRVPFRSMMYAGRSTNSRASSMAARRG
jgi:hypothetical protein